MPALQLDLVGESEDLKTSSSRLIIKLDERSVGQCSADIIDGPPSLQLHHEKQLAI